MDSSFYFGFLAGAVTIFTLLATICFMFRHVNKTTSSSSSTLSSTPPSVSRNSKHDVFPSFHGPDVRKAFLTHILKEFRGKGINPFIDNNIERSKSIGPELVEAIRGSRIAIVLLSRNYASSSWCLNELVEIMKCREELGQRVMTIFYEVDPTDVKKQTGDFGKVFKKTCKGKTKEEIKKWRKALEGVATIAGEHSRNWVDDAAMIEKIAIDVSNMLNNSIPSRDSDGLVGMGAHMVEMEMLLRLDLDEVRMVGIWGPSGIGKTTIARFLFNRLSSNFQLNVFMENLKELMYSRPVCSDDYNTKLLLQKNFMSQITNHRDIEIHHLGVAQDRLNDKKVLVVLDDINQSIQLDAIAKDTRWFGHGSRIIITTQDRKVLKAHGVNHIYKVALPSADEACQIFCMNAFRQKFPEDGFEELAREITYLAGELPLALRVMGSYFRGMSKQEWINALPRLRTRLDANIHSIFKFSFDALRDEDKELFLHIACIFKDIKVERLEDFLRKTLSDVRHGLHLLAEKSLIISTENDGRMIWITIHNLIEQFGKEIVRHDPWKHQFLVDARDICEVLTNNTGSKNVTSIWFDLSQLLDDLNISQRAFEEMSNLKFLIFRFRNFLRDPSYKLYLPQGLNCLPRKLRLLCWECFPMTCLPSNFCTEYLVKLSMYDSKLEKLWEGNQPLGNLKMLDLSRSRNLKEIPDLSSATNLEDLNLAECTSIVELPSSIGKAINLSSFCLRNCTSLVKLPTSIGNATNLRILYLKMCTSLVELPSSIGNLRKLEILNLKGCSKLEVLPIISLESLVTLDLANCLRLRTFPEITTNVERMKTSLRLYMLRKTETREVSSSIKSWSRLRSFAMSYNENLGEFPHAFDVITKLYFNDREIQEIPQWVKRISSLEVLKLRGCKKLVSLPQLSYSLRRLKAVDCESLERLDCSLHNPDIRLEFVNCLKLNQEARELIIQTRTSRYAVLPGVEVPAYFTHRAAIRGSLTIKLNERPLPTSMRLKACILLTNKDDNEEEVKEYYGPKRMKVSYRVMGRGVILPCRPTYKLLPLPLMEHLYIFEFEVDVTSNELSFEFRVISNEAVIKECGVTQL